MKNQLEPRREGRSRNLFDLMNAFDDLFSGFSNAPSQALSRMMTDVQEDDKCFVLSLDMPGVSKDDIQIRMEGNLLVVSAEKQSEKNVQEGAGYQRQYRRYQQSFNLPNTVKTDQIEASYENGVLELLIPKSEQAQPRKIEIQSGKGSFLDRLTGKSSEKKESGEVKNVKH